MNVAVLMVDTDPVPQLNPRQASAEDAVAQRIRYERERRGWSTGEVARRMAEVGRPVNQTAIWKIESGNPRRTISLDEALALAQVFGLTLQELTQPPDEDIRAITQLLDDFMKWNREEERHRQNLTELLARARDVLGTFDVGLLFDDAPDRATFDRRIGRVRDLAQQLERVSRSLTDRIDLIEHQGEADFIMLPPDDPGEPQ